MHVPALFHRAPFHPALVTRRLVLPVALAATAAVAIGGPASAHVTVNPSTVQTGGFTQLAFRVPNESASASTTGVQVTFPAGTPLAFVSVKPVPGWTAKVEKAKLDTPISSDDGEVSEAVSKVSWTGGSIRPGEYQDFDVSVGPLPEKAGELTFKVVQTYSDGEIVRWIDVAQPGAGEPEHPAPVLTVAAAVTAGDGAAAAPGTSTAPAISTAPAASGAGGADTTGRVLGGAGLVAGLAALGVALARRRRPAGPSASAAEGKQTTRV